MNPKVIERLLNEHGAALQLLASQWCHCAEDCVQKAFIKLALLDSQPDSPVAWLYRVVKNEAISVSRSERRRRLREQAHSRTRFQVSSTRDFDAEQVDQALATLPVELREIVLMKVWGGLTLDQISQVAEISRTQAHRKYHDGLNQLRIKMGLTWLTKK